MSIDRAQVGYNPTPELVQVLANPNRQDIQVRNDQMSNKSMQLAAQLGAQGPAINKVWDYVAEGEREDAANTVNSMSREDLAAGIKDNSLNRVFSPVYNATLKNLHYANTAAGLQRDTLTKLTTGELSFDNDPEHMKGTAEYRTGDQKLNQYLLEQRNNTLAGADKFGVAGFDKNWTQFVAQAQTSNAQILAKRQVENGIATANDTLRNAIAGPMTDDQLQSNFLKSWAVVTEKSGPLLTDAAKKESLKDITYELAKQGHTSGLNKILDTKLDNGISVRAVLGGKEAAQLEYTASAILERKQNKAEVDMLKTASVESVNQNHQEIANLVSQGRGYAAPKEQRYLKPDGTWGYQSTSEDVYRAVDQKTKGMSLAGRIGEFNTQGIVDVQSQNTIQAGINNLSSITWNAEGKQVGEYNPQFDEAFKTYQTAKMVDPAYAGKLAGDGAKMFEDVEILRQTMGMDTQGAALVVAQARNNPTYINGNDKITKQVDKVVNDLNPSWFGNLFGTDYITGNVSNIRADVKRSAELMIAQGADPDKVLTDLGTYLQKNTANINGSLIYLRSVPSSSRSSEIAGGSVTQLKRLHEQIGTDIAMTNGHDPKDVQMSVSKDGGLYTFTVQNQPIIINNRPMVLTKSQVEDWMERDFENYKTDKRLQPARDSYEMFIRANGENAFSRSPTDKYLTSATGYRRMVEADMDKKPLKEQRAWAKKQLDGGSKWYTPATPVKDYSTKGGNKSLSPGEEVVNQ